MPLSMEIAFKYRSIEPLVIWKELIKSTDTISPDEMGAYYDIEISFSDVEKAIRRRGKPHFNIEFNNAVFQYGAVGNFDFSFLLIEKCIKDLDDSCRWIEPFLDFDSFIQGRVYDKDYDYWQNASDPLEFESAGRSYDHLPMKSNALPPPLEQKIIDTSKNPGRKIFRDGYIEAIGSLMWFGDPFWQLTGKKKESILCKRWIKCEQILPGVLFIKATDAPFMSSAGKERELQENLRTMLF